jgi:hypothetical protein
VTIAVFPDTLKEVDDGGPEEVAAVIVSVLIYAEGDQVHSAD